MYTRKVRALKTSLAQSPEKPSAVTAHANTNRYLSVSVDSDRLSKCLCDFLIKKIKIFRNPMWNRMGSRLHANVVRSDNTFRTRLRKCFIVILLPSLQTNHPGPRCFYSKPEKFRLSQTPCLSHKPRVRLRENSFAVAQRACSILINHDVLVKWTRSFGKFPR